MSKESSSPDRRLWDRAFEICAARGWDSDNMFNWCNAIRLARKEEESRS